MVEGLSALTGEQLRKCRELARLSTNEMAVQLGLAGGSKSVRDLEAGKKPISGPIARCALTLAGIWPYTVEEPLLFSEPNLVIDADPDSGVSMGLALASAYSHWAGR